MTTQNHFTSCPSLTSGLLRDCSCNKEKKHYFTLAKISFGLFVFEFIGGFLSGSVALMSDALHVLFDGTENIISALVSYFALRGGNEHKMRNIGGKISALLLLLAAVCIVYEGYERITVPHEVEWYMVLVAFVGLCTNIWQKTIHNRALKEHRNQTHFWQNWHLMSDIAASVAVVIGGCIMLVVDKWYWIDGVLSVGIGFLILTFVVAKLFGFEIHSCGNKHQTHKHGTKCNHKH